MSKKVCIVLNCNNTRDSCKSCFTFPTAEVRKKQWLEILKLKHIPTSGSKICEDHFKCSQFSNRQKTRLKIDALPYRKELEFGSGLSIPQIGGEVKETLQYGPSTSVTKQITPIRQPRSIIKNISSHWSYSMNLISTPPVDQSPICLPNRNVYTTIGEEDTQEGTDSSQSPHIMEDPETTQMSDSMVFNQPQNAELTVRPLQDCLFCLHPIEQNDDDTQEHSTDVYRDIFECSKELLKDKINFYSEWIYSEEFLSPLCVQCFKSCEKMYEVNQKLIEFKKMLDELADRLTVEINDRISKVVKDEDLEEIKMEDDEIVNDVDSINDDYSNELSPLEIETESIDICYSDADCSDEKEDPLKTEAHCITEQVDDESVGFPPVDFNCGETLSRSPMPSDNDNSNTQISKDALILFPRVVLHRLKPDDYNSILMRNKECGVSTCKKRKATSKASVNLQKSAKDFNSVKLPEGYISTTNDRNMPTGESASSVILLGNPTNVIIALPVEAYELTNLICNICQKKFSNLRNLVNHKRSVCNVSINNIPHKTSETSLNRDAKEPKDDIFCDICGKPDKSWSAVKDHKLSHKGDHEKRFQCSSCGKGFSREFRLKEHFDTHHLEESSNVCDVCGKRWKTKKKLLLHMKIHSTKRFNCPICKASFKTRQSLYLHKSVHEGKSYPCSLCSKICRSEILLKQHKKLYHSGRAPQIYVCGHEDCSKTFRTRPSLRLHKSKHHAEQENLFECTICKKKLKSYNGLKLHIKNHGDKQFQCTTCGKQFFAMSRLRLHSRHHQEGDFECRICGRKTNTQSKLNSHMRLMHRLQKNHLCELCGFESKTKTEITIHIETVHKRISKYKCDTCGMSFGQRTNLKRHEETHKALSERKMFTCEICGRCFKTSSSLQLHQVMVHSAYTEEISHCGKCGNKFSNGLELYIHNRTRQWNPSKRNPSNPSKCPFCIETFPSRCDMLLHCVNTHPTEMLPYQCETCQFVFNNHANLKDHLISTCGYPVVNEDMSQNVFDGNIDCPYKCSLCRKAFKSKYNLRRHQSNVHNFVTDTVSDSHVLNQPKITDTPKEKKFQCHICGKVYTRSAPYNDHIRTHTGERPYICETCGKSFTGSKNLRNHKKSMHSNERPFVCSTCGKTFAAPHNLKLHETTVHSNERPFVCSTCGKTFAAAHNLKLHEKSHSGEKQFSCSFCDKTFLQKCNLQKHERTHTGEKPFQCNYCEKSFVQSTQLKTHVRIHTGEKPFSCSICAKTFSDQSTWYKHKRNHTA